ncbi:MAG: hypothetical protein ACLFPE_10035 [Bacteroidales bacterium]
MHTGEVVVMWLGDDKKKIFLPWGCAQTAKGIQTECSRYSRSFLMSDELIGLLKKMEDSIGSIGEWHP